MDDVIPRPTDLCIFVLAQFFFIWSLFSYSSFGFHVPHELAYCQVLMHTCLHFAQFTSRRNNFLDILLAASNIDVSLPRGEARPSLTGLYLISHRAEVCVGV